MKTPVPFKRSDEPGAFWYVRFKVRGRTYLWSTRTDDRALARARGKQFRDAVIAESYQVLTMMRAGERGPTFTELFKSYDALPSPPERTRKENIQAFKLMLNDAGVGEGEEVFRRLDAQLVVRFQRAFLAARKGDDSAAVSANSRLRKARSLFSRRALASYDMAIPDSVVRAFFKVPLLKEPEPRRELPTEKALAEAARVLLGDPEAHRAYLLARYGGLRAGEIVAAKRDWLDGNLLYIGGRGFVAKGKRWRVVELPPEAVTALTGHDDPVSLVGPTARNTVYRRLPQILLGLGFPAGKPLHSLRRLYGSVVYATQSPQMAKEGLGHASIATTDRHYVRALHHPKAIDFAG